MKEVTGFLGGCLGMGLLVIALVVVWWWIGGFILMVVWNALLPYLLGAPTITHLQGVAALVGLSIIGSILRPTTYLRK